MEKNKISAKHSTAVIERQENNFITQTFLFELLDLSQAINKKGDNPEGYRLFIEQA